MRWALAQNVFGTRAAKRLARPDDSLRRVAGRLAMQTVLLLLVMLLVLEAVVYIITQQTLISSLETSLQTRAGQADPDLCQALPAVCGGPTGGNGGNGGHGQGQPPEPGGNGPPPGPGGSPGFTPLAGPTDVSAAYVNQSIHLVHWDGYLGRVLLSDDDAEEAVESGKPQCCSVHRYASQDFLVYTAPLVSPSGSVVGAVQTSISEHQYEQTMNLLLRSLIIVALLGILGSAAVSLALVGRALRPIRAAMQRQRDFVADAAHELRTPLAIQRTVAEIGMAEPTTEELQSSVAQMLGENRHLTRLVEDLSLLARTDTGVVAIERKPVDLSTLVAQTAEEIGYLAADRGITLDAHVEEGVTVSGDILRLRQLLLILLDNALKHTPEDGVASVRLDAHGGRARMEVADSGPGIRPEDVPHIFDRFYRADQARTGEGTGLGLAIARWIVGAHAGQITAGNVSPHGAVFTVTLPLARGSAAS